MEGEKYRGTTRPAISLPGFQVSASNLSRFCFIEHTKTPSFDRNNCLLNQAGLNYEVLANILYPAAMTPGQLNAALSFSLAPTWSTDLAEGDYVYITMRFIDPDGQQGKDYVDPDQVQIDIPLPPDPNEPTTTSTFLGASPNPSVYGNTVTFTATVVAGADSLYPRGSVELYINGSLAETIQLGVVSRQVTLSPRAILYPAAMWSLPSTSPLILRSMREVNPNHCL